MLRGSGKWGATGVSVLCESDSNKKGKCNVGQTPTDEKRERQARLAIHASTVPGDDGPTTDAPMDSCAPSGCPQCDAAAAGAALRGRIDNPSRLRDQLDGCAKDEEQLANIWQANLRSPSRARGCSIWRFQIVANTFAKPVLRQT